MADDIARRVPSQAWAFELVAADGRVFGRLDIHESAGRLRLQVHQLGSTQERIILDAANAEIRAGGSGANGDLQLYDAGGLERFHLDGGASDLQFWAANGERTVRLRGDQGNLRLGSPIYDGDIQLISGRKANGDERVTISMSAGDGLISMTPPDSDEESIAIDGALGDIRLAMADFAEEFPAADPIPPGTVVVLAEAGSVRPCAALADHRVCGVAAGAGGYRPAIIADHRRGTSRVPISLLGKTGCLVDATVGPIQPGDLLVTSPTLGHACRLPEGMNVPGTILGKSLARLDTGRAVIPVLLSQR